VTTREIHELSGYSVPITFREHRASTPPLMTGYLHLLDGEPVENPVFAAVRRALRAPLAPAAAVTSIAMAYWNSGRDLPQQKAEIVHWLDRFLVDIRQTCTR
jgi:hypothetical protein